MKKNISINISGIIFHIEEDGYDRLNEYLESIQKYFSTFEDSTEIIADIESRIAEIFLSKLKESKQVITNKDVENLVSTMGSIQDFQAIEEQESSTFVEPEEEEKKEQKEKKEKEDKEEPKREKPKKLYRDAKRRLLGGVAAGIAHYFSIDPLWIRLIFIVVIFDVFLTFSIGGLLILVYIVMWIAVPESDSLEEDKKMKKMYRNPDDRVLGGIASGAAAYFGTDVVVIRVLLVLSILLGGAGLIAYLILWIILPEATTITEKVQMKGESVTLSNIESSIKNSLNVDKDGEESVFVKILLFPFRLIALIFTTLGKALGPALMFIVELVRILVGAVLSITGVSILIALIILSGVLMGLIAGGEFIEFDIIPFEIMKGSFPVYAVIASLIAAGIPALMIILLGITVISKSRVVNPTIGWSLFAIWMLSLIFVSFTVPTIVNEFKREGTFTEESYYDLEGKIAVLKLNETGMENYEVTRLRLRGYDDDRLKLVKEFESHGRTRQQAMENAQMITYNVNLIDSVFLFDSNIRFKDNARFRAQRLNMTLYIPYNYKFIMDKNLRHIIHRNTLISNGYNLSDMEGNEWIFTTSGLECITCDNISGIDRSRNIKEKYSELFDIRGYTEEFEYVDFTDIQIEGPFDINVIEHDEFKVILNGRQRDLEDINVDQEGKRLIISHENKILSLKNFDRDIKVYIALPELDYINFVGGSKSSVTGFDGDYLRIKINGGCESEIDINMEEVDIDLNGASKLRLTGRGNELRADISAASQLEAYSYRVRNATVDATAASTAEVYVTESIDMHTKLASKIKYRGGAKRRRN